MKRAHGCARLDRKKRNVPQKEQKDKEIEGKAGITLLAAADLSLCQLHLFPPLKLPALLAHNTRQSFGRQAQPLSVGKRNCLKI